MDENANEIDILFETHECACGWRGDEDELVNSAGHTLDELEDEHGPGSEEIDYGDFRFCPSCYAEPTEILG